MDVYSMCLLYAEFPLVLKSTDFWRLKNQTLKSPEIGQVIWSQRCWKINHASTSVAVLNLGPYEATVL